MKSRRPHAHAPVLDDDIVELHDTLAGRGFQPRTQAHHPTEHHLDQPIRAVRRHRLAHQPATVTELIAHVDLSQPLVSWHLRRLRAAGVIATRRAGREVICTISREALDYFRARDSELLGLAG